MYWRIFGFQRLVWWPKCTPASSRARTGRGASPGVGIETSVVMVGLLKAFGLNLPDPTGARDPELSGHPLPRRRETPSWEGRSALSAGVDSRGAGNIARFARARLIPPPPATFK